MKLKVVDKETKKVVWNEEYATKQEVNQAIRDLKENNFNPDYFDFQRA